MSLLRNLARFSFYFKLFTVVVLVGLFLSYLSPFIHPNTIKIVPFFGLAYPVIISITFLLLICWAFARSRWFFYVLIALICGGSLHFRTLAFNYFKDPPSYEAKNTWKLMTYNVRLFDLYNPSIQKRNETRDSIVDYIRRESPDIVCFQEFFHQDKPSSFSTKDTLLQVMNFSNSHDRYSHRIRNRQNFGICMISKYPMIAKGDIMFQNFKSTDNYCIYADIVKGMDTIRFYNVHLQSIKLQQEDYELFGQEEKQAGNKKSTIRLLLDKLRIAYPARADQALRVVEHIKTSPYPVVVCGDFNDTPLSFVYNQFSSILVDSYRETSTGIGATYVGKVPAGRIDFIFHTGDIGALDFNIQNRPFSDHRAIQSTLYVK